MGAVLTSPGRLSQNGCATSSTKLGGENETVGDLLFRMSGKSDKHTAVVYSTVDDSVSFIDAGIAALPFWGSAGMSQDNDHTSC